MGACREVLMHCSKHPSVRLVEALENDPEAYMDATELISLLKLCYNSLVYCGDHSIAQGTLLDVLRQAHTFGLHLCRLDIRQESIKHTEAMDVVSTYLGLGSYKYEHCYVAYN